MRQQPIHDSNPTTGDGIFGLPHRAAEALVHLVPVPFEATVSYRTGTINGPQGIHEASTQVDLLDPDVGRPHRCGVWQHPESSQVRRWSDEARRGDARIKNRIGDQLNTWLADKVEAALEDGRIVGVIGGDHSVPFAAIQAHARRSPGMGILHFDAHFDLREAYEGCTWSHASVMHNVLTRVPEVAKIVAVGVRDYCDEEDAMVRKSKGRVVPFLDADLRDAQMQGQPFTVQAKRIAEALPRNVYVSFDIDGLDPFLCPNTGTPVPGGLSFQQACAVLNAVVSSGRRIVGFDLVEVAPAEGDGEWNANVGARVLYKLIGATLRTRIVALSPARS